MADDDVERVLWIWTASEVALFVVVLWILWGSVFGDTGTGRGSRGRFGWRPSSSS